MENTINYKEENENLRLKIELSKQKEKEMKMEKELILLRKQNKKPKPIATNLAKIDEEFKRQEESLSKAKEEAIERLFSFEK